MLVKQRTGFGFYLMLVMQEKVMKMLALIIVLVFTPLVSHAEWGNHSRHNNYSSRNHNNYFWQDVQQRQHKQSSHINRGIDKGQLTRREIRNVKKEQKHVAKQIRHYKRHNHLSYHDKRIITNHLNHVSGQIRNLKHNDRYARNRHHHQSHANYNHRNSYRRNNYLSWTNAGSSAGIYFRF